MFQCIIQHKNGLIYNAPELKHVFPGNKFMTTTVITKYLNERNFCFA